MCLLPQVRGCFFIVNIHGLGGPPLPVAFNLHNLYLAGFMFENCWYFFSDADLLGSGHDLPGSEGYWMLLPFGGGYEGEVMEKVHIGIPEMFATYETLTRLHKYIGDPQGHVEKSCFRLIVVLPEA